MKALKALQKLKVSKMTGKLTGIEGINTSPLNNAFCEKMSKTDTVCKVCYSRKMLQTCRISCIPSWSRNGMLLSTKHIGIDYPMPKFTTDIVRFSAHGELFNLLHFKNLMKIVEHYPNIQFTLWTKRRTIIQRYKEISYTPENVIFIYSDSKINSHSTIIPKYFHKRFIVHTDNKHVKINCGSKRCTECMICYSKNDIRVVNELLK